MTHDTALQVLAARLEAVESAIGALAFTHPNPAEVLRLYDMTMACAQAMYAASEAGERPTMEQLSRAAAALRVQLSAELPPSP